MLIVLVKWILKLLCMLIDFLGPSLLLLSPKDPPFHILGLHDKDAVGGDDDVVDLGSPLLRGQGDILDEVIGCVVE